jgi:hypothetical protein
MRKGSGKRAPGRVVDRNSFERVEKNVSQEWVRAAAATLVLSLSACGSDPKAATEANFTRAIDASLEKPGAATVCLNNMPRFPYDLAESRYSSIADTKARYDAYVFAGLAEHRVIRKPDPYSWSRRAPLVTVHQYRLSSVANSSLASARNLFGSGNVICYASYRVGKIVNFTEPGDVMGVRVSQVRWTPRIVSVADWAKSDKVKALPEISTTLASYPTTDKNTMVGLTNKGWEAAP